VNYQSVYLWFCHRFVEFMVRNIKSGARIPKTAVELDAVNQGGRPCASILQWKRLGAKDSARLVGLEFKL
jgi:hypothetical protein